MDGIHDIDPLEKLSVAITEMLERLERIEKKLDAIQTSLDKDEAARR